MGKCDWNFFGWLAGILVVVGAVNWGLVGLFGFNLVSFFFSAFPLVEKIVYVAVGVSGLYFGYKMTQCKGGS